MQSCCFSSSATDVRWQGQVPFCLFSAWCIWHLPQRSSHEERGHPKAASTAQELWGSGPSRLRAAVRMGVSLLAPHLLQHTPGSLGLCQMTPPGAKTGERKTRTFPACLTSTCPEERHTHLSPAPICSSRRWGSLINWWANEIDHCRPWDPVLRYRFKSATPFYWKKKNVL